MGTKKGRLSPPRFAVRWLAEADEVGQLDADNLRRLAGLLLRLGEMLAEGIPADLDLVHEVGALRDVVRSEGQSDVFHALVDDSVGILDPLSPRQGLDFPTLPAGDAFLDRCEVLVGDSRPNDSDCVLSEDDTRLLARSLRRRLAIPLGCDELTLAILDCGDDAEESFARLVFFVHCCFGLVWLCL